MLRSRCSRWYRCWVRGRGAAGCRLRGSRGGESDLLVRDGMWFLLATCEVPEGAPNTDPHDFLGVDTCAECGHIDKANRVSQAWFACRSCGFVDHADRNSSRNIRARAWELWRRGALSTAPAPPPRKRGGAGCERSTTASGARCASPAL
ncbi:zinc ribbon domain-containing protein [Streptomyces sp. O3]